MMPFIYHPFLLSPGSLSSTNQRSFSLQFGIYSISRMVKISSENEQKAEDLLMLKSRVHGQGYSLG